MHHRASLEGLAPGTQFFYRCGNPDPEPSDADGAGGAGTSTGGTGFPGLDVTVVGEGAGGGGESGDTGGVGLGGLDESEGPSPSETATPGVRGARGGGGGAMELRDAGKWSSVFSFVTAPEAERWVVWHTYAAPG